MTDPSPGNLVILTMGRVSVDLYAEQVGVTLAQVRTFRKVWGAKVNLQGSVGLLPSYSGKLNDLPLAPAPSCFDTSPTAPN